MKRVTRSATDRKLAGVCGGIGAYFGIDPTIIRIGWVVFCLMGGSGVLAYLLCALIIPEE
jgi:phage shock protein PspC (stress-responsive transcriptional regulator)